jgi:hypothetical protein
MKTFRTWVWEFVIIAFITGLFFASAFGIGLLFGSSLPHLTFGIVFDTLIAVFIGRFTLRAELDIRDLIVGHKKQCTEKAEEMDRLMTECRSAGNDRGKKMYERMRDEYRADSTKWFG